MNNSKTSTLRQRRLLNEVFNELADAPSISDSKRILQSKNNGRVNLANPALQPIAFSLRHGTWLTYALGIAKEIAAWVGFSFYCLLLVFLTRGFGFWDKFKAGLDWLENSRWVASRLRHNAYKKLRSDNRPPILYLRSFSFDDPGDLAEARRLDEQLAEYCERDGPLIAVAGPNDEGVQPGAVRLYFGDEVWRPAIIYLMSVSQLIIIQSGITHGTLWEIGIARRILEPRKLVISLAHSAFPSFPDMRNYEWFREYAEELLACPLPPDPGSKYIGFGKDWAPLVPKPGGGWQPAEIPQKPIETNALTAKFNATAHTFQKCIACGLNNWFDATSCERCGRSLDTN